MTKITLGNGSEKRTFDADLHNGYLVIPGTKIPFLDERLLAKLSGEDRKKIKAKIEAARADDKNLETLWHDGEVLRFTLERPNAKFVYIDFLKKFQDRNFDQHPIENALSAVERQYVLASVDLNAFKDKPSVVINLLRSLSEERLQNLFNSNADKIAQFVLDSGTAEDVREFLTVMPEKHRQKILAKDHYSYSLLLRAISNNKKDTVDVILEFLSESNEKGVPKELQFKILKNAVGEKLHPRFNENVYFAMLPITLAACKAESNVGAVEHAYKLAVLFSKPGAALNYLEKWTDPKRSDNSRQPVHDALLFRLPHTADKYNHAAWEKLAIEHGRNALKHFGNAERVEDALAQFNEAAAKAGETVIDLAHARPKDLDKALRTITFARFRENPGWANLCASLNVSERVFEDGLEILPRVKKEDHTPDIGVINGADIGQPGYYMRKLAPNDPKSLLIGLMVNCCNHIDGGATSDMAESQVTSPDAACYVIFKEEEKGKRDSELDTPIGKSTGWMSKQNNFVFNSWERLSDDYSPLCEPFFSEAARRILAHDPAIGRVLLGKNRDFVKKFTVIDDPEKPRSLHTSSYDSGSQYLISERPRSAEIEQRLKEQSGGAKTGLWEAIVKKTGEMGLSSTQIYRLQKKLKKIKTEIDEIGEIALRCREHIHENRGIGFTGDEFSRDVRKPLHEIEKFMKSQWLGFGATYSYEGRHAATAFISNIAIEHVFGDLIHMEYDSRRFRRIPYESDSQESQEAIALLAGRRSITEYAQQRPKQLVLRAGLSAALLFGAGSGVKALKNLSAEYQARENAAIKLEQENPGIFRALGNVEWTREFQDVDISDVKAVRAKFGDKIKINDIEIPVEVFVEQVAPALNTLEEIRKQTPPGKWDIKGADSHKQRIEQAQPEQKTR